MKVYVDMDDVLCETAAALCSLAEREFGRHVRYEDVREFDLQRVFSLSDSEMSRFREMSHSREMLMSYPVTPDAVAGLLALRNAGHEVDIVTGRPASSHAGTEAWLESAGLGGMPVTYVDKYGRTDCFASGSDDPKTVSLAELKQRGYGIVVDDSPVILARLADWCDSKVLVFSRPWNESFKLSSNMRRISTWRDLCAEADVLV